MKAELHYTHTLKDLVAQFGCEVMAERLGLTRAAVRQMLNADRQIFVKKIKGNFCYAEIKPYKHANAFIKPRDVRPRSWKIGAQTGRSVKPASTKTPVKRVSRPRRTPVASVAHG